MNVTLSRLATQRAALGITQDELAIMAAVTPRTIQRIESGAATSIATAKSIAAALNQPSYHALIEDDTVVGRNPNPISKWHQLWRQRTPILIGLTAITCFLLMLPVEGDLAILLAAIAIYLPVITTVLLTYEPEPLSHGIEMSTWQLLPLMAAIFLTTLSAPFFLMGSLINPVTHMKFIESSMALMLSPGNAPLQNLPEMIDNIWLASGIVFMLGMALIHVCVRSGRSRGVSFYGFHQGFYATSLVALTLYLLYKTTFMSKLSPPSYFMTAGSTIAIFIVSTLIAKQSAGSHFETIRSSVQAGIAAFIFPALVSSSMNAYIIEKVSTLVPTEKLVHCQAAPVDTATCWSVQLLRRYQIPINKMNLDLLEARAGAYLPLIITAAETDIGQDFIANKKPLPPFFTQWLIDGYSKALRYHIKNGTAQTLLSLQSTPSMHLYPTAPETVLAMVELANTNPDAFQQAFLNANLSLRQNAFLRSIYIGLTGNWSPSKALKDGVLVYDGGVFSATLKHGRPQDVKEIQLRDIAQIMQIPAHKLPQS